MKRRRLLQSAVSGGILFTAGCTSLREDPGPFNFGVTNWRDQQYFAEIVLRNDESIFLDVEADIPAHPLEEDSEDPKVIIFDDVANVTDGDVIEAQILINGSEYETEYEVTCNSRENAESGLWFRIYSDEDRGMEYQKNEC